MRTITSFLFVLLLVGCASLPIAHLTKKEVTQTATAVVQKSGYRLDDYQAPKVIFHPEDMRWSIYFEQKPPGDPGGYVCIFVDDKTGVGKLVPSY